ncbi:uncharacterized protein N7443_004786 [Penicillium atrosanguineum]|uniref:uncharacterized protein n=1 Tax=Penicillium atrosanguineum TaxID=1132637 RepID=UPI0023A3456F|nr:uncharacterized protein N7443_004786 [Penicillium atrosanguineum]KAJ5305126.1 hypothetical protein N7443_004786 [Penicillium atrosanguineum]
MEQMPRSGGSPFNFSSGNDPSDPVFQPLGLNLAKAFPEQLDSTAHFNTSFQRLSTQQNESSNYIYDPGFFEIPWERNVTTSFNNDETIDPHERQSFPAVNSGLFASQADVPLALPTETDLHSQHSYLDSMNHLTESIHRAHLEHAGPNFPVPNAAPNTGLPRRRSRYLIRSSQSSGSPIFIPSQADSDLNPMQRWQESPPEDEPASRSAIISALRSSERRDMKIGSHGAFNGYRRPASLASSNSDTSFSSHQSIRSTRSEASSATQESQKTQRRNQNRVRKTGKRRTAAKDDTNRPFCCTFCCDKFKSKYDWVRHEKSLHLNLEGWVCAPHGGFPISPLTGRQHCVFCYCLEPSLEHLDEHNYGPCSRTRRTFRRKDHLVQHLRLAHRLDKLPVLDEWKTGSVEVTSRCGFCDHRLESWEERVEHLAAHFKKGLTMRHWHGDHDFEPSIAAQVMNAVPPYLLASESISMVPFSATNSNSKDHLAQISSRADGANIRAEGSPKESELQEKDESTAMLTSSLEQLQTNNVPLNTFLEVVTMHLGQFARQNMSQGIIPTDEMFQREARRVLYDSDDPWNQTFADNPEWISNFRRNHYRQNHFSMEPGGHSDQ